MFVVNSRLGLSSAAGSSSPCPGSPVPAILFPKLRIHFAEFLNEGFPAHLRILSPPTCVGLRYGHKVISLEAFLDSVVHLNSGPPKISLSVSSRPYDTDLPVSQPTAFDALFHPRAQAPSCVTPSSSDALWYWNFCQLSFAYALCLGLGPDLP